MSFVKILQFGLEQALANELREGEALTGDPRRFLVTIQATLMDIVRNHVQEVNVIIGSGDIILQAKNTAVARSVDRSLGQVQSLRSGPDFAGLQREQGESRAARQRAREEIAGSASEAVQIETRQMIRAMDESSRGMLLLESRNRDDGRLLSALLSAPSFEALVPQSLIEESVKNWIETNRRGVIERVEMGDDLVATAEFNFDEVESGLREPVDVMSGNPLGSVTV